MGLLHGHLGSSASALVDGQLDPTTAERAWDHVAGCESCRRLVERESWVKRQLARVADTPTRECPPDRLLGSLRALAPAGSEAPRPLRAAPPVHAPRSRHRRRAGLVLAGAGSVSAAVIGITALGGPSALGGRPPAASIGGGTATPVVPARSATGRGSLSPNGALGSLPAFLPAVAVVAPAPSITARLQAASAGPPAGPWLGPSGTGALGGR